MNPMHVEEYKNKFKETIKEKQWIDYDTLYKLYIEEEKSVSDISKLYNKKYYQVQYYLDKFNIHKSRKEITKTVRKSNMSKYGVDNIMKCDVGVSAYHKTMKNKYGSRYSKNTILQSKESIVENINMLTSELGRKPHISEVCKLFNITHPTLVVILQEYDLYNMVDRDSSRLECIVEDYIKKSNVSYIRNTRKIIPPYELDFFIPEYKIAFEVNDIASHSYDNDSFYGNKDIYYHQEKSLKCREKGILLIHLYEWQLLDMKFISKLNSYLMGICGLCEKIRAHKCNVKVVNWKTAKEFINENHLQNSGMISSINLGLYYKDELIQVMTFAKSRYDKNIEYELLRLCTKSGYRVYGGSSKLIKYFIEKYEPKSIVSYCNLDNMRGSVYEKIGFKFIEITPPTYTWCNNKLVTYNWKTIQDKGVDNILGTNYGKGKSNIDIMHELGYFRIFNSGNLKFIYFSKKV